MTPIEDYLNEYTSTLFSASLAQFDEPEIALNLRRGIYPDRPLTISGIVPGNPIELPANITSDLLNNLLTEGDNLMNTQSNPTTPLVVAAHNRLAQLGAPSYRQYRQQQCLRRVLVSTESKIARKRPSGEEAVLHLSLF